MPDLLRERKRTYIILLVEDNPGDIKLTEIAFRTGTFDYKMFVAEDGAEAMDFLHHEGKWLDAPRPDLILLDLNIPKKTGHEVLAEMKADRALKRIPVVMLTSSRLKEDIENTYDLHGNCFITKPLEFNQFTRAIHDIQDFWLSKATLPN